MLIFIIVCKTILVSLSTLLVQPTTGVKVRIDGKFDLGQLMFNPLPIEKTSNSKQIQATSKQEKTHVKMPRASSKTDNSTQGRDDIKITNFLEVKNAKNKSRFINRSTAYEEVTKKYRDMYVKLHKVKDDAEIADFTEHIYKESMKVFESIKAKTDDYKIKKEIDSLSRSYETKFGDFVKDTQDYKIKTRLGKQKVIMNTMQTSDTILKRLVNYLQGKMDKQEMRHGAASNVLQNEVDKKLELENSHICNKFGICRSQTGFSNFLVGLLDIVLGCEDKKFRQIADAITEVLKYSDLQDFMEEADEKQIHNIMPIFEANAAVALKPLFQIMKNIIANRNKPIEVVGQMDERVNKTVAFLEILDDFEKAVPPNEKNGLQWKDILSSLQDWNDNKRSDILDIVQTFFDHLKKNIAFTDRDTRLDLKKNMKIILSATHAPVRRRNNSVTLIW